MLPQYQGSTARVPDRGEIIAFVVGVLPFVCNISTTTTSTSNGRVTAFQQTDYVALAAGAVVILLALASVRLLGRTLREDKIKRYGIIAGLLALGVFQLLRGFGVFTSP